MKKRVLSILLALCMVLMLVPTTVFAVDDAAEPPSPPPEYVPGAPEDGLVDVSEKVVFDRQYTYYFNGTPVAFNPTCDGIKEWSYLYYNNNGVELDNAPCTPGEYTVIIIGYGEDCYAKVSHTYSIVQKINGKIEYTAYGYTGVYDGKPHTITVKVTTSDVTVTYATSVNGTYSENKPDFTNAGVYTVYYKLEKAYCKTVTGSATVTIEKAAPELYFTPDSIVFNPGDKSRQLEWIYTGDGSVTFTSSNAYCVSADPTSGVVTFNSNGSATIWVTAAETGNYKEAKAKCLMESVSTLPTASGYSGEYDGKEHSITVEYDPNVFTIEYSKDGGASWQNENPTFKNVGSYTVHVKILKGSEYVATDSATVTITQGTPELYFTPGNIVFEPGEKSRQLKWVYNGDGKLYFTSSDSRHFWVDPSGGLVSLNQDGGVSIWVTAPETSNWKSVTAMCIVETESTLPQIDIDTKLDIDYQSGETEYLVEKVKVNGWDGNPVLYVDAKLIDPRDPEHKKELHNVRASFTVPYKEIPMESAKPVTAYDFTVLHQRSDGKIEEVRFIPRADGLQLLETTCSPFAIVCLPKENYNVYYDVNGGTGTPMYQRVPISDSSHDITLTSDRPQLDGYSFKGWSISRTGDVQYMPGDTITLDRDIILYAIWDEEIPRTGDDSSMGLWLTMMIASLSVLACVTLTRRKKA